MSRKIKVVPFDLIHIHRTTFYDRRIFQEPYEIISPVSWELNVNTNAVQESGVLGNTITYNMPFPERTYRMDWVGSRKEINQVLNYFTKNSHRHFVLGNLTDQNVVTPGVMLNSKGMLASVAEKHRFPGATYTEYLPEFRRTLDMQYDNGFAFNVGSMGVRVAEWSSIEEPDYSFLDISDSAVGVVFLEKNTDYTFELNPVGTFNYNSRNNLDFLAHYYALDNDSDEYVEEEIRLTTTGPGAVHSIASHRHDRILALSLLRPSQITSSSPLSGILNYIPPIIHKGNNISMNDYEDIPSLLMPVDDYVYNIISPNVAELSMNFKEITHVSE